MTSTTVPFGPTESETPVRRLLIVVLTTATLVLATAVVPAAGHDQAVPDPKQQTASKQRMTVPATVLAAVPATVPAAVPATVLAAVPATVPAAVPAALPIQPHVVVPVVQTLTPILVSVPSRAAVTASILAGEKRLGLQPTTALAGLSRIRPLNALAGLSMSRQLTASESVVAAVPAALTKPFGLVGLSWSQVSDRPQVTRVLIRTKLAAGSWTPWQQLQPTADGPDVSTHEGRSARGGTEPLLVDRADGVEVLVLGAQGRAPVGLRLSLVDGGSSPADAVLPMPTRLSSGNITPMSLAVPTYISRAQWGADPALSDPSGLVSMPTYHVGFIHHTVTSNTYVTAAESAAQIRMLYAWFTTGLHYSDMAYNILVDRYGRVYEGRAGGIGWTTRSAATGGFNEDSFSVAALGDFQAGGPTAALLASLATIVAWKLQLQHRDPAGTALLTSAGGASYTTYPAGAQVRVDTVSGHRDVGTTLCPGANLYPTLPQIRTTIRDLSGAGILEPSLNISGLGAVGSPLPSGGTIQPTWAGPPVTLSFITPAAQSWTLTVTSPCLPGSQRELTGATIGYSRTTFNWDLRDSGGTPVSPGNYTLTVSSRSTVGAISATPWSSALIVLPTAASPPPVCGAVRITGTTAVAAGLRVASLVPVSTRFHYVVVASSNPVYARDGLIAAPWARALGAPVLLTGAGTLDPAVGAEILRRGATVAYVIGGTNALSVGVDAALRAAGIQVRRVGSDRAVETSALLARMLGAPARVAILANIYDMPTLAAVAAVATATGRPLLLSSPTVVDPATSAALTSLGIRAVAVIGGTAWFTNTVLSGLPAPLVIGALAGGRAILALAVATAFKPYIASTVISVVPLDDVSSAAVSGAALGRITVLSSPGVIDPATLAWLRGLRPIGALVLADVVEVNDSVLNVLAAQVVQP